MTKFNEFTARAARNPQPVLQNIDAATTVASLVSDLPTPVFTPSTLANLEEVFSYNNIPSTVTDSEVAYSTSPFQFVNSDTMKQSDNGDSSDYSDDENSREQDYLPLPVKRGKSNYVSSVRSESPDMDSQPLRRRKAMRSEDNNLSAEDYARVMQRRERNKLAAARCRQRRVDLIDKLKEECNLLEGTNANLESSIEQLRQQKEQLEFILKAHQTSCEISGNRLPAKASAAVVPIMKTSVQKQFIINRNNGLSVNMPQVNVANEKPVNRPTSLLLTKNLKSESSATPASGTITAATGIPITTPSSLLSGSMGFELLLDGHTGLTPLVPVSLCSALTTPQLDISTPSFAGFLTPLSNDS